MSYKTFLINHGPSNEVMFDGLRLIAERRPVPFEFTVNGIQKKTDVIMHSIRDEAETGWSWVIEFSMQKEFLIDGGPHSSQIGTGPLKLHHPIAVKGYYSTKTRNGFFVVKEEDLVKTIKPKMYTFEQLIFLNAFIPKEIKASKALLAGLKAADIKWFKNILNSPLQITYLLLLISSDLQEELKNLFRSQGLELPETSLNE